MRVRGVDAHQLGQRRTARRQLFAEYVQQAITQRLGHAGATIVSGAAAEAEHQLPAARIQRRAYELAGAVAAGDTDGLRVALGLAKAQQAGRLRGLDYATSVGQEAPGGV